MEKGLYEPSSTDDLPAVCRSVWDLALRDISTADGAAERVGALREDELQACVHNEGNNLDEVLSFMMASQGGYCRHVYDIHYL